MTGIASGDMDALVVLLRSADVDDGTATVAGQPREIGRRWAKKVDVSDAEKVRADERGQSVTSRFIMRDDALARSLGGSDTLSCRGKSYEIIGVKDSLQFDDAIEITGWARADQR